MESSPEPVAIPDDYILLLDQNNTNAAQTRTPKTHVVQQRESDLVNMRETSFFNPSYGKQSPLVQMHESVSLDKKTVSMYSRIST